MVKVEIIFDESIMKEMEMIFKQTGIKHYTLIENVKGKGTTGSKFGTAAAPGKNSLIITIITPSQKEVLIKSIKKFKSINPTIGIKMIISKIEDFI